MGLLDSTKELPIKIGYIPRGLSAMQSSTDCSIEQYRLGFKDKLALIAVDASDNPCDSNFEKSDIKPWYWSEKGIFTSNTGSKHCLRLNADNNMEGFDGAGDCTNRNDMVLGAWQFGQPGTIRWSWCMGDVPGTESAQLVVDDLPAADPDSCSGGSGWHMEVFDLGLSKQTGLARESCQSCVSSIGNFACATDEGCKLAPTESDCHAHKGDWCAGVAPPSPPPTPKPSSDGDCCPIADGTMLGCCSTHDCCPRPDGTMLECCSQSDFMFA